ncbi:MAG: hypothetical protein IIA41_01655 [SAR324 cluster bacterium]|nr:hypothetical protein [SAR324 cluster bacterium]
MEFKDNDGKASGRKIYVQLKSGDSHLRTLQRDGRRYSTCRTHVT